jgi:16S rRNA (adenine1518-N6/adenine1519-N6)-dimethyltransferase
MRAKKELGQHFLISSRVVDSIIAACASASGPAAAVLEIGPGRGAITGGLLGLDRPYFAIELDYDLAAGLSDLFPGVRVALGDARELDLAHIAAETGLSPWLVVGNLPYNAGTEILRRVLATPGACCACVVMLQREVAQKFCGDPGKSGYGPLSVWTSAWWDPEILFPVPPGAFSPPPKVTSAVCCFAPRRDPELAASEGPGYWNFLRAAFRQPRKTLAANLSALCRTREQWALLLEGAGLPTALRPGAAPAFLYERLFMGLRNSGPEAK